MAQFLDNYRLWCGGQRRQDRGGLKAGGDLVGTGGPWGTQLRAMVMGLLKTKHEKKKELKVFSPVLT